MKRTIYTVRSQCIETHTCLWQWGPRTCDVFVCRQRHIRDGPMRVSATKDKAICLWKPVGFWWDRLRLWPAWPRCLSHQCMRTSHIRNVFWRLQILQATTVPLFERAKCCFYLDSRVHQRVIYLCHLTVSLHMTFIYSCQSGKVHDNNILYSIYTNIIIIYTHILYIRCTWSYHRIHDLVSPPNIRKKIIA
jgi:hypothetical protein